MPDVKPSAFTQAAFNSLTTDSIPYTDDQTTTPLDRRATLQQLWDAINILTAETAPAIGDKLPMYDADGSQADAITLENMFKVVNSFTELTDPDAGDFLPIYDATATAIRKIDYDNLIKESFIIACSDESTAITATGEKVEFRMPYAFTVTEVRASLTGACSSGTFTVDIHESGTTIMTTNKLTFDATEKTTESATTPPALTDTSLADDAEIQIDVDNVGDSTATGLKVYIIGHRT